MGTSAPGTSGTSRTSRPTTARRRPPKLKENVTEVGRLMVPDAKAVPVAGIMKDGDNNDTDSEDEAAGDDNASHPHAVPLPGDAGAHGRLVRDILKDQSAEEAARRAKEGEDTAAASNEAETGIRLGRRKKSFKPERMKSSSAAAASSLAEMNALRADIQRLCQAANPVGKSVEFVHEDLDAMAKELEFWRKEYARKRDALAVEQKRTEEALQPLQVQLREVEEQVKEQLHKINTLKVVIAKNEEKTQQLLRMVVSA
jgi:TRAF3-interacting protein 1